MKVAHQGVPPDSLPLGIWHNPAPSDNPIASLVSNFLKQDPGAAPIPTNAGAHDGAYGAAQPSGAPMQINAANRDPAGSNGGRGLLPPEGHSKHAPAATAPA